LVGIAGEDDLDAPELMRESSPGHEARSERGTKHPKATTHRQPVLDHGRSILLRDQLLSELGTLKDSDEQATWAQQRIPDKNSLTEDDARIVDAAYLKLLQSNPGSDPEARLPTLPKQPVSDFSIVPAQPADGAPPRPVTVRAKEVRRRSKAHLLFVGGQPCLICERFPCDAHHLKFAQPRALGRKVSDEFTVPLCREHHHELHRHGNEAAWWANMQVAPIEIAKALWQASPIHGSTVLQAEGAETVTIMSSKIDSGRAQT